MRNKFIKTTAIDALFYFIIYSYLAFFSPYLDTLGWSEGMKGLFFSMFSITSILIAPVIGTVSDKVGRFKLILAGFIVEMIALLGYIMFTQVALVFVFRILSAVSFNMVVITSLSRVNDVMKNEHRSRLNGLFQTFLSIATMIAPLIGGFVADTYGLKAVFVIALIICIVVFLSILLQDYLFFKEAQPTKKTKMIRTFLSLRNTKEKLRLRDGNPLADIKDMLSIKKLQATSILGICTNFTAPVLILVLPYLIIQRLGLTNTHLSIVVFLIGAMHLLQFFFGIYVDKIGKGNGIYMGLFIFSFSLIALFFVQNYYLLLVVVMLKAIGGGLWNVSVWSYMSDVAEKHHMEGKVVGSFNALSRISMAVSFAVSGVILMYWGTNIFLIYGFIAVLPLAFVARTILGTRENQKKFPLPQSKK